MKGEISYINGTTHLGSQVSYECTPGNRLSGHRVRFCGPDGRWTGGSPKCEEIRCDAPELPLNGSAIYIGNDRSFKEQSFSVGVTVQYECDYGHVVRGSWSSRLCQANGEWSGEPPKCKFVECGKPPNIENGQYVLRHPPAPASVSGVEATRKSAETANQAGTFTYYGTIAHYSCESNYKLQGSSHRECLENGQWRVPLPTCEPVQCPKPEFFDEFTQVNLIQRADSPDQPTTAKAVKLISNNQWTSSGISQFGIGDKLIYSCTPGYELYGGPDIRVCTQYGQWSGSSTPRCRLIDCGKPSPIGQEGRYYLLNETTTFNSLVEYSCVRPFKLVEFKIRLSGNLIETLNVAQAGVTPILTSLPIGVKVCANNGQWMPNDQQPKCVSAADAANGQFDGSDNSLAGIRSQNNGDPLIALSGVTHNHDTTDHLDMLGSNQQGVHQSSASLWPKVIIAVCLMVMLALIILTLICIKSGKKSKHSSRPPPSTMAANHFPAMQIQLNSNGAISKCLPASHHQSAAAAAAAAAQHQASILSHQNMFLSAGQKMLNSCMMNGMTGGHQHHPHAYNHLQLRSQPAPYGDSGSMMHAQEMMVGSTNGPRSILGGELGMAKAHTLGVVGDLHSSRSSDTPEAYLRLSIDSDSTSMSGQTSKMIRHNPNGLVTFVSPAQQQQQQQQQQQLRASQQQLANGQQLHQASPHSLSSSSSPSSSGDSAHHTTATRLSTTDSGSSSSYSTHGPPPPQTSPPSLPANPPPSHRIHPKQSAVNKVQYQASKARPSAPLNHQSSQSSANQSLDSSHYMDPTSTH